MCVCVLVQSGIDVNRINSYEQTALEVVNKFTASRGAREIKQMLRGNVTYQRISVTSVRTH